MSQTKAQLLAPIGIITCPGLDVTVGGSTPFQLGSTGIITAVSANFSGNVTVGGTLTYEDVTSIDSVGVITARDGIKVTSGGIDVTAGGIDVTGDSSIAGNLTLPTTDAKLRLKDGNNYLQFLDTDKTFKFNNSWGTGEFTFHVNGGERLRIGSAGQVGIGGTNYGTSGQVLTSQGASAAPQWSGISGEKGWQLVSSVYLPDLGGTQDNVDFVGLSTAYTAYKVQFTGCTFITTGGARSQDKVLAYLRDMNGAWVTGGYGNRNIRMMNGVVKYDSLESFMALTSNDYCDCISGDLIIPMARNNVNSSFGNKLFYGQFITDSEVEVVGCTVSASDIRSTGFDGIRLQSDDHKWHEGRISLYRLPYS
tara:strand:- start:63 stop:1157 length:1095 start_codon:yes stop_codon:yes gene_type:complete